jgi:Chitobiase/beta-hexosaminidase C-terminal domain
MKKITLSLNVLAAIIAMMILQACAGTQCATPTLTPPNGSGQPVPVTITTASPDCYLSYTLDGSKPTPTNGTQVPGPTVQVPAPDVFGRTLQAIAYKKGVPDSVSPIASGTY